MKKANVKDVLVTGIFDDIRASQVRFLEEAARLGRVCVLLWSDAALEKMGRGLPMFPQQERLYFLRSLRYVDECTLIEEAASPTGFPTEQARPESIWAVDDADGIPERRAFCQAHGMELRVVERGLLAGFPPAEEDPAGSNAGVSRVLVTGCYDWLHSGHIRFFEEAGRLGELYVVVGHDANIRLLKGDRHPLFPEAERRYMVGSVRYVRRALISSGNGWVDAEPEIARIKPEIYVVNTDGDNEEKREFCRKNGLRYVVLKRTPREGLPRRQSRDLRGF